jgi:hypothetical protein
MTHQDEVEQRRLVHLHELSVPVLDLVLGLGGLVVCALLFRVDVELAVLDYLCEDAPSHVGKRDGVLGAGILDQVLDSL